jgi:hypothetical protein
VTGQDKEEYVLVPRKPTEAMLYAASDAALAEDAGWVWESMIESYESSSLVVESRKSEEAGSPSSDTQGSGS